MNLLNKTLLFSVLVLGVPLTGVAGEKDCLLQGTVQHGGGIVEGTTQVKIHSISKYDEKSRCSVRRSQKMEFKLPQDTRLKEAPSGSEVKYRYRTDDTGQSRAELISVGA